MRNPSAKRCIFCFEEKRVSDFTKEHVFPYAIGSPFTISEVCKDCNSYLGANVDSKLTNHIFIEFRRFLTRIASKNGTIPNPLGKGVLAEDHSRSVHYYFDDNGKPKGIYITPKLEILPGDILHITVDENDKEALPEMVNKKLIRAGYEPLTNDEIYSFVEEVEVKNPPFEKKGAINLDDHYQPILKICYEMGFFWLGYDFLRDETALKIRELILDKGFNFAKLESKAIRGDIDFDGLIDHKLVGIWDEMPNYHYAIIINTSFCTAMEVRIFDIFRGFVIISETPNIYNLPAPRVLVINAETRKAKEGTLFEFVDIPEV